MTWRMDGKIKSAIRKPLRDVSNSGTAKKSGIKLKKTITTTAKKMKNEENVDPLDRLLFVHSDISALLRQIDELVVQAVKVKMADNEKSEEIKTFTDVLSGMHSTLKLWVPRLQKALVVPHIDSEVQLGETSSGVSAADVGEEHEVDTPEPTKQESLVSPSPLVSWRAVECTVERGKQLFLLTPLPRPKRSTSKAPASSKPVISEAIVPSTATGVPSHGDPGKCTHEESETGAKHVESTSELEFMSPSKLPIRDSSSLLVTPCLKNSPPRSCVPQETDRQFFFKKIDQFHKSTPFPVGNKKLCELTDSDSSSGEVSEKLGLKYPELIGIKLSSFRNGGRAVEASPAWMRSPPKCCTLMEPVDEKPVKDNGPLGCGLEELSSTFIQQLILAPEQSRIEAGDYHKANKKELYQGNFSMVESTPLSKACAPSTIKRGKRPGENTLKKELWTKFEAASTHEFHFNPSKVQDTTSKKGFLDMLEEASCEL